MKNHFVKDKTEYKRNINIVNAYYNDSAKYLSKMTGKSIEECLAHVKKVTAKDGKFPLRDPDILCLSKEKEGEREKKVMTFGSYMQDVSERKDLLAPTFTSYLHPKRTPSILSMYIDGNLKKRSKLKKESLSAKMNKNMPLHYLRENQQNSTKIKNNALSGAHASNGTPLANKSSHSTLTSVCRCATSYGNASNEKFISGNRHYWCPDIVTNNIINICNNVDLVFMQETMDKFNIKHPSIKETLDCITYSTNLYWKNIEEMDSIKKLVISLSDIERSAFVYCGDLYHLAKYNDKVIRDFIDKLTKDPENILTMEASEEIIKQADSDMIAYISLLGKEFLRGKTLFDAKTEAPDIYKMIASYGKNVINTLDEYQDFIKAFFVTNTMPTSISNLPNSIRRSALASDTDSTIFTVQEWGKWYTGKYDFSKESCAITVTITYLTSQAIIHILAMMCANMGVDKDDINKLQMKNEYAFPVFVLTPKAKHYYATMSAREGNVYEEMEKEVKGVGLRPSTCPTEVMDDVFKTMDYIMNTVIAGKKISIEHIKDVITKYENDIRASVEKGEYKYLTKGRINGRSAYKNPNSSAYVYYDLWTDVFAPKYGHCEEPPYSAIKVSVNADNKTALMAWLDAIEDKELSTRFKNWLTARGKSDITSILLPESIVASTGIPKEIIQGIDIRNLIYSTVKPFYSVLESVGIFMVDDNVCRLVSDYHVIKEK